MKRLLSPLAAALALSGLAFVPAQAGETMLQLLKILKDRGSITESEFQMLVTAAKEEAAAAAPAGSALTTPAVTSQTPAAGTSSTASSTSSGTSGAKSEASATAAAGSKPHAEAGKATTPSKWYDRLGVRGYVQLRYTKVLDQDGADLLVPNDASVSETGSFMLRRGRVVLSGNATERLFVYAQADLAGSLSSGDIALSMRDYYADVALDHDKEYRVRLGQSKVPFGFVNMQSSQNRAPMERPDALNSAVEGERDIGAFFYWAPKDTRKTFQELVSRGLKGSGDYGVVGVGAYSGQGLNRLDANGEPHVVARVAYPWKLDNGQFIEAGLQGYHGKYASGLSSITLNGSTFTPTRPGDGLVDERVAATFVWYPQPFGVEAEWNFGRGPELNSTTHAIESEFLHGGYVQVGYRIEKHHGDWYPFARWHYYDGGRKFATNAPHERVHEVDVGLEWAPWPELELTVSYTHTFDRTNTRTAPYLQTEDAHRLAFQAQYNF